MIYDGRLNPGQRLLERELSQDFAASRVPLPEPLLRLESEGLVGKVVNSAPFVEDFSVEDVLETYLMRLALESPAAHLAAVNHCSSIIGGLQRLCQRMTRSAEAGDLEKFDSADYQFHLGIVEASMNRRLTGAYNLSHIQVTEALGGLRALKRLLADTTASEHGRVIYAIDTGDGEAAERATYQHVCRTMQKHGKPSRREDLLWNN